MKETYPKTPDKRSILPLDEWCNRIIKIVDNTHSSKWVATSNIKLDKS